MRSEISFNGHLAGCICHKCYEAKHMLEYINRKPIKIKYKGIASLK